MPLGAFLIGGKALGERGLVTRKKGKSAPPFHLTTGCPVPEPFPDLNALRGIYCFGVKNKYNLVWSKNRS